MARPKGAKAKHPTHEKVRDELLRHKFDWVEEFVKLYNDQFTNHELKAELLLGTGRYLFPIRAPETDSGQTPALISMQVSDDQLKMLLTEARDKKA